MALGVEDVGGITEQRRKVRSRCLGCGAETFHVLTLGMRRIEAKMLDGVVRQMIANVPFECGDCGTTRSLVRSHFPVP
ncbi:hypothetical protein NS230_10000 [Methylobacterium indicum]|nr:hypothetical protein NS229_14920 [Methylobacterium indicum]KTS52441.1 hypothetical protein NS230_10000 [Methylobacterium indicum]